MPLTQGPPPLGQQFLLFALVGAFGTAVHYIVLIAGVQRLALSPTVATSFGFVAGALINYALNYRLTFRSGERHIRAAPRFFLIAFVGALVNGAIVAWGTRSLSVHYLVVQLGATATVLMLGFLANRFWTFGARPFIQK